MVVEVVEVEELPAAAAVVLVLVVLMVPVVVVLVVPVVVSRRHGSFPSGPRRELLAADGATMDFGRGFFSGSLGGAARTTEGMERRRGVLESMLGEFVVAGFWLLVAVGLSCKVPCVWSLSLSW